MKATRTEAKKKAESRAGSGPAPVGEKLFALLAGLWIGLSLMKFGNPVIFDSLIPAPGNLAEFIFTPWPLAWGYLMLAVVVLASALCARPAWRSEFRPILLLGIWLFWQFLSNARSVEPRLSNPTLLLFASAGVAFLLGLWALPRVRSTGYFWVPVILCFFYVLFSGFDQHHGGLESMRKAFYEQPDWQQYPKEYLLKMQSNRIFSTLVYPNAFAGVILIFLPVVLWQVWALPQRWPRVIRGVLLGTIAYLGLACLYWTGSKGGWLIALALAAVLFLHLKFPLKIKASLVAIGLVLGLVVFFVRFSGYFEKGATSVSARFIYWQAAIETAADNPVFGTGPGTFQVPFARIKPPEAEMAKLVHNDYLEQASDSGIPGFLAFTGFVGGSLVLLYRKSRRAGTTFFMVWIGLLAWSFQSIIEFGLYIPALIWPVFLWFGWLWSLVENGGVSENCTVNGT